MGYRFGKRLCCRPTSSCSTGLEGHHLSIPLALDNELTARTCPGSGLESGPACQQEPDANR
jgi:hypothetical protein